jgi:hypothetical protein
MQVVGLLFFFLAFVSYAGLVRTILRLVKESRGLNTSARFNCFWWTPAWKIHRAAFPYSPIRRQIISLFLLTFALMMTGTLAIAVSQKLLPLQHA